MLEKLTDLIHNHKINVYTLAQIQDGKTDTRMIQEANVCNNIYSVSKNFTATAIGILRDRGMLSLNDTVYDIFHAKYQSLCSEDWKHITIENVLTQTIGIDGGFLDIDSEDASQYGADDYMTLVLKKPLIHQAGTFFCYSDSNYYLLSRIAAEISGEELSAFLRREIFLPLNFQSYAWACCPLGHAMGATGLFLRVIDMAKFGQLYLNGGVYSNRRILSEQWVADASRPRVTVGGSRKYGYSFWSTEGQTSYQCCGAYAQIIDIAPDLNRVIAWSAYDTDGSIGKLLEIL